MTRKQVRIMLVALLLPGCAGFNRGCSAWQAENFASDWIVVQNDMSMTPQRCWKLPNTSITNEPSSDGVYWLGKGGHLVHISGWYNRVQVTNGDWNGAARSLGIDLSRCGDGVYQRASAP